MKHDWKNIDWQALKASRVAITGIISTAAGLAGFAGHSVDFETQTAVIDGIAKILDGIAVLGTALTVWWRVTAQPEGQTVIVPKKEPATIQPQG